MPRARRICFPGAVYHVMQRGNRKQDIFVDDIDKWHLLKLFLEAKKKFAFLLHCYVLMLNHFHLTIETPNAIHISKIMQFVTGSYAVYFNKRHSRNGHLFQGRFKDILVEKEKYLLKLSRYIHLNPVKAGITTLPEDYKWSSYGIYLGLKKDCLVDTGTILGYLGDRDHAETRNTYKNFVEERIVQCKEEDWLQRHLMCKRFLASKEFVKQTKNI